MYNFGFTILTNTNNTSNYQSTNETHYTQQNTTITTPKGSQLLLIATLYQQKPSDKELRTECTPLTYLLTYLHTYSIVQSPSWEVNWFAASQEIPRISRNPKVHYGTHKRPPPVSTLGQPNPVHIPTSHLLEIRPNIIHPSTLTSGFFCLQSKHPACECFLTKIFTDRGC